MSKSDVLAISASDIDQARERLAGAVVLTPLIPLNGLSEAMGGAVFLKFEGVQRGGSFKFRGALNRLAQLSEAERKRGVVAFSSGNHAQGIAHAARYVGTTVTVVMPADAPQVKIDNTSALGAEVVLYDRAKESREDIARAIADSRGAVLVPSFDDPAIIAGQGSIGREILEQLDSYGCTADQILVPCGGGGLISGIAMAVRSLQPEVAIYSVEPEGFDDTARSLAAGRRIGNIQGGGPVSICDALLAPTPGVLTFAINQHYLAGGLTVSEALVRSAVAYAFREIHIVVEPGGAVALAAILGGSIDVRGRTTVIVASGSNIDPDLFMEIITEEGRNIRQPVASDCWN